MNADPCGIVMLVLSDATRIGYQLRMNIGGRYLDQLRLVATILAEQLATTSDAADDRSPGPAQSAG